MLTQENKDILIAAMLEHGRLDRITQGLWWDNGKGCHIGCCGHAFGFNNGESNFTQLAEKTGIDEWLLRLSEKIFEGLESEQSKKFSIEFCESLPVNVDFNNFLPAINIARMDRSIELQEVSGYTNKDEICDVLKLVKSYWENPAAESARSAAESAAWSARSAAESAAWSARSAAWSARSAAESAAESAWSARSAAESAAESARSAAESARSAAESAAESARSAAESAAESARSARSAAWVDEMNVLLSVLKS